MFKRMRPLLISVVLLLVVFTVGGIIFAAGNDPYRIVLRYYDPIQITYTIKYPVGDIRDEWTGPEDVPIGGVGTPDPGNKYGIIDYISTQIYCVDPFTAFHSKVPGWGGNFEWDSGAMADTVTGYVSAVPWNISGAMQIYGDAVRWIAANGYRGTFNYGGTDDAESQQSVARLNAMFPNIGPVAIDKEIAVMATKVAIWKVIAGDNIQIVKTTLDKYPDRLATFNALIDALVNASKVPTNLNGEVTMLTTFDIQIINSGATYDDKDLTYDYYGPMTVEGKLENTATPPNLDKVFLTVNGIDSGGVRFTTDALGTELNRDFLFGTTRNEQFIGGNVIGDTWTSDEFYLAIPKGRTPERGDQLLVQAMAKAPDVTVNEGTPIVYAFAPSGSDVQDWDAIQAFIGGANRGATTDLYAEAKWHTGDTSLGDLYISKQVKNNAPEIVNHIFTFEVYYGRSSNFAEAQLLNLTEYPVHSAYSVDKTNNTFTLKNGGLAYIQGLPMAVSGGDTYYEYYYWVKEVSISVPQYNEPHFEINIGQPKYSTDGNIIGPFRLDNDMETAFVTVTNTYSQGAGNMILHKRILGSYDDWGVDDTTVFEVRIKDVTNDNYLLFTKTEDYEYEYECYGNSGTNPNNTDNIIKITGANPVTVTNLWDKAVYQVQETSGAHYSISYTGNNVTFAKGESSNVVIENTYDHDKGNLIINKRITGYPEDWGVDDTTVFEVRIKDVTDGNYLLFDDNWPGYTCIGNNGSLDTSTAGIINITADRPTTITNLWVGHTYEIEEVSGEGYSVSYEGKEVTITEGQASSVTVTNTFERDTGSMRIFKRLNGNYTDRDVNNSTIFQVRVKDVTNDNYLLFSGTWPNYTCNGSDDTGDIIEIRASSPTNITNLWTGIVYEVQEIGGANYTVSYEGNNVQFNENEESSVTVINTYEPRGRLTITKAFEGLPVGINIFNSISPPITFRIIGTDSSGNEIYNETVNLSPSNFVWNPIQRRYEFTLNDLPLGFYRVYETGGQIAGFILSSSDDPEIVWITSSNNHGHANFVNRYRPITPPPIIPPPIFPPTPPPVEPPIEPPPGPPIEPPGTPPTEPPTEPPVTPPSEPPIEPPVTPPTEPPAEPNIPDEPDVPYVPETPDIPDEPEIPNEPETPETPPEPPYGAQTGDDRPTAIYIIFMIIGVGFILSAALYGLRKKVFRYGKRR